MLLLLGALLCFPFCCSTARAEAPVLVVGVDNNFPPFEFADKNGVPSGYTVDLIKAIASEEGLRIRIVSGPWDALRRQLVSGQVDVLAGMFYSRKRTSLLDFSIPHSSVTYSIFVRKGERKIRSEADLVRRSVWVQGGDIAFDRLSSQDVHVMPVVDEEVALKNLAAGQGDAVVAAKVVGFYIMKAQRIGNLQIAGDMLRQQEYCFAVRRNRPDHLLQQLNEGLTAAKYNGVQQRIAQKWLSPWEQGGVSSRKILLVVGSLLGLLALASLWSWILRQKVRERTLSLQVELAERHRAEQRIRKLNRFYVVRTEVNKLIVRLRDREALYREVCRLSVEHGGFLLAWIGAVEEEAHLLRPVAQFGLGEDYLGKITISTLDESAEGRGPGGTAAREGRPAICHDIAEDPIMAPWRAAALARSFRSSASLPLKVEGKTVAVLNLYASESHFFDDQDELALLNGVASDVSFALEVSEQDRRRERTENALHTSEERLRTAFEQSAVGMALCDLDAKIVAANSALCEMLGYSRDELTGMSFHSSMLTHAEDLETSKEYLRRILSGELPRALWEKRYVHKDGHSVWAEAVVSAVRDAGGQPVHFIVQIQDITARKRGEEALRRAYKTLEGVFAASPVAIMVLRVGGEVVAWNKSCERMFGWSADEAIGQFNPMFAKISGDEFLAHDAMLRRGETIVNRELRRPRKDGTLLDVSFSSAALFDESGQVVGSVGVYTDLTERKRLETQLLQSQKLESVGRLAGGVAHDFNNLLTVINCYTDLLLGQGDSRGASLEWLREIRKAGERASSLTKQLLAFSRRQVLQPKVFSANDVITDMKEMLQRLMGEDIEIVTELDPEAGNIKADPGQIQQVIMNLAVNARDAMPQGGKFTIRTGNAGVGNCPAPDAPDGMSGSRVVMTFGDTGCGMSEETQRNIFEPFFTTKESGRGTGLGLSTVWGIVKQSGGQVNVSSEAGKGSTFEVVLPRVAEQTPVAEHAPEETAASRGTETILLVEDQAQLRQLTSHILKGYGYKVVDAANAMEALQLCTENGLGIDLVLTDIVMPDMTGIELGRRLRLLRPDLRLLYMSGYTDDVIVRQGSLHPGAAYLEKPFTPEGLAAKIREVLEMPAPSSVPSA